MSTNEKTTAVSIEEFIQAHRIRMSAEQVDRNPQMDDFEGDHWKCVLRVGTSRMTVHFSKGYGHHGAEPQVSEVLDCLASDATSFENARSFEEWARDYGYNTDSRKAEKTYRAVEKQATALRRLLGDSYETLLWNTERQ